MKIKYILIVLICIISLLLPAIALAQSTVDADIGNILGFSNTKQRHSFYVNGLYWVFYEDGNNLDYRTSSDSATWSAAITIRTVEDGSDFGVYLDGSNIHYAAKSNADNYIKYRQGVANSNGTITWIAAEGNVVDIGGVSTNCYPSIAVDTNGLPWIAYYTAANPMVTKSTVGNGTWLTDSPDFPYSLGAGAVWNPLIVPLTNGRMFVAYKYGAAGGDVIKAKRWTGVAWGAERETIAVAAATIGKFQMVAQDDDVHIVSLEVTSHNIIYAKYEYSTNSFVDEETLYDGSTLATFPIITKTNYNDLYVFWVNDPTADHVYYIKYNYYQEQWGTYIDLVDESIIDGLPSYGYPINTDSDSNHERIGLYYVADPQHLKYKDVAEAANVTTLAPTAITSTNATFRGDITSVGTGSITTRGFQYNTSASPTGAGYTEESGTFGTGVYSLTVTDLELDELYYCRAYVVNSGGTTYGEWIGYLSAIQSGPEQPDEPDEGMAPPVDTEGPVNWVTDPSLRTFDSWPFSDVINAFADMVSRSFAWFCFMVFAVSLVGIALCKYTRHLGITFLALGMLLGLYIAGDAIDWWLIFPYLLVGISLIIKEQQYGWG